jgi:hypothetical protein
MSWKDFLGGMAENLPKGVDAFNSVSQTLQNKQKQQVDQTRQAQQDQLTQQKDFISGADFKRQLQSMNIDTSKLDFQDQEQIPWVQAKETLDHVATLSKPVNTGITSVTWDKATPEQQAMAKSMAEGRIRPYDLARQDRSLIVGLANEYANKNKIPFTTYEGDVKATAAKAFGTGKQGQNAASLNTAIGHADTVKKAYEALGNTDVAILNKPLNWLRKNSNDPNIVRLGVSLDALRGELANVFKNSGGTDQEIAKWENTLSTDLTPTQVQAVMPQVAELLNSRIGALTDQQQNIMTQPTSERQLISEKSKNVMKSFSSPSTGGWSIKKVQ